MIETMSLRKCNPEKYDEVWLIARHPGKAMDFVKKNSNVFVVPELSPSEELFSTFYYLKNSGKWNQDAFDEIYKPEFLEQIMFSNPAISRLRHLLKHQESSIALVCFCSDKNMCHRRLIGEILKSLKAEVAIN